MILRRLKAHVEKENWFAVFIDFAIVVIGVFIGIQVANWNEARSERIEAREYIDRVQEDLLANQRDMRMRIDYFSSIRRHGLAALEGLSAPAETLDKQFLTSSFIASFSLRRSYQSNTFDELLSAGAMNTMPDVNIRNRISEYYRVANGSEYYMNRIPDFADLVREVMPYDIQFALRSNGCRATFETDAMGTIAAVIPQDCALDVSQDRIDMAIEQLLGSNLEPELTRALADYDLKLQVFEVWIGRAQALYDYLETAKS